MSKPVLVKLGGSVLTDKSRPESFQRTVTRRLLNELRKADVPIVLLHGAGSFGHPQAEKWGLADGAATPDKRKGVSEVLATVGLLHAEVVRLAAGAGLKPVSVPLHTQTASEGGMLTDLPVGRIQQFLKEGYTPVLHGTLVRDDQHGWRIVSADELMEELAPDLEPRLALFVTDVDGVYPEPPQEGSNEEPIPVIESVTQVANGLVTQHADTTGGMERKVHAALALADSCPVLFVNGKVRGRMLDALKGKHVVSTRVG